MSSVQDRLRSLSPTQRELLLKKIRQRASTPEVCAGVPSVPSVHRLDMMPLSLAQERMWFIEQLEDTQNAYAVTTAGYVDGELSSVALSEALKKVVGRHEILRTSFGNSKGKPFQSISPESKVDFLFKDLRPEGHRYREKGKRRPSKGVD